jgi:hypothetical protein
MASATQPGHRSKTQQVVSSTLAPACLHLQVCEAVAAAASQALQYCAAARGAVAELHAWRVARGEMGDAGNR